MPLHNRGNYCLKHGLNNKIQWDGTRKSLKLFPSSIAPLKGRRGAAGRQKPKQARNKNSGLPLPANTGTDSFSSIKGMLNV